ncbi:17823_t:CDS:10, partial [Dentiscutata erythropus]
LCYNARELFEIHRNEQDPKKIQDLVTWGWQNLEFLKAWRFVEKEILNEIFRGYGSIDKLIGEKQLIAQAILSRRPGSPPTGPKPDTTLPQQSNNENTENTETSPISSPKSLPSSTISNKYQIPTSFTIHRFNPATNPNNTSNADALLPEESAPIKGQPTTAATTTNVMASSSVHTIDQPTSVVIPMPSTFVCKRDGRVRWCEVCNYVKPDRCHHCSESYTAIYADFTLAATIPIIVNQYQSPEKKDFNINFIITAVLGFIFGLLLTGFSLVHTAYVLQNRTTIETLSFRTRTYNVRVQFDPENPLNYGVATTRPGENIWSLGWKQNWKLVMGDKWWLWFVPFGSPPGNGLSYPYNNASHNRLVDEARRQSISQEEGINSMMQQAQSQSGRGGHYVKMVHNGLEYGDVQLTCEAYYLIKEIEDAFEEWIRKNFDSYLIKITRNIVRHKDTDAPSMIISEMLTSIFQILRITFLIHFQNTIEDAQKSWRQIVSRNSARHSYSACLLLLQRIPLIFKYYIGNAIAFLYSDDTFDMYGTPDDGNSYNFNWNKGEKFNVNIY